VIICSDHLYSTNPETLQTCQTCREQIYAAEKLSSISVRGMGINMTEGMHTWKYISISAIYCVGGNFTLPLSRFLHCSNVGLGWGSKDTVWIRTLQCVSFIYPTCNYRSKGGGK